jgi:long-chain acyl-CoA synthetase
VGRVVPGVECKIGKRGLTRGPHIMKGYFNKPEERKRPSTPTAGSTPATSGEVDEDGFLMITDRKKKSSSAQRRNIAPAPIQGHLEGALRLAAGRHRRPPGTCRASSCRTSTS